MYDIEKEQVGIKIPRYAPGTSLKNYSKKKTMSIFCCIRYSYGFRCPELIRARITTKGDVYVIPYTEYDLGDFHISHHKSGKFHWFYQETHVQPIHGEDDFAAALRLWLKLKYPPCLCLRKGKNLNDKEIISLLRRLAQYLPFTFNIEGTSQKLKDANFCRFVSPELKRWEFFSDLLHGRLRRCLNHLKWFISGWLKGLRPFKTQTSPSPLKSTEATRLVRGEVADSPCVAFGSTRRGD